MRQQDARAAGFGDVPKADPGLNEFSRPQWCNGCGKLHLPWITCMAAWKNEWSMRYGVNFDDAHKPGGGYRADEQPSPWLIVLIIVLAMAMLFVPLLFFPLFIKGH